MNVVGVWSMPQLSFRLRQVAKGKQWQIFQQFILFFVLIIWFAMVTISSLFTPSTGTEIGSSTAGTKMKPLPLLHARKLAWIL